MDSDQVALNYNLRFPGQNYDAETGKHYNFNRDYNPVTGRYVQSDPIGLDGGMNGYGYAENNSQKNYDVSGLKIWYRNSYSYQILGPAMREIRTSQEGRKLTDHLHASWEVFWLEAGNGATHRSCFGHPTNETAAACPNFGESWIYIDMTIASSLQFFGRRKNSSWNVSYSFPFTLTRILAHELGHMTFTNDDGHNQMNIQYPCPQDMELQ